MSQSAAKSLAQSAALSDHDVEILLEGHARTFADVRALLEDAMVTCSSLGLSCDALDRMELSLAEAMTNVVEHALVETGAPLRLSLRREVRGLVAEIRDEGRPLPNDTLPGSSLPDANVEKAELPEGGFGWFLIHSLTDEVVYLRQNGENRTLLTWSA